MNRFVVASLGLLCLPAVGRADALPHPLAGELVRIERETCPTSTGYGTDFVHRIDFDGDGRLDVVLDYGQALCGGDPQPYCTAQGCLLLAWRAEKGGWRAVFAGRVRSWSVGESGGRRALIVDGRPLAP